MSTHFFSFLILVCFLTGCNVGPVYEEPECKIPCEWHSEPSPNFNLEPSGNVIWWEKLNDPLLNQLITCAAAQNLDVQIAAIRVLQARAEANAKKGDLYPHVDASLNYDHVYYSKDALVKGLIGTAAPTKHHVKRNVDFFEAGFDADWEIDLFGLTRHEIAALKAQAEAAQETLSGVWVTLSAEIARNYVQLRGFQHHLEISKRMNQLEHEALLLTEELAERGVIDQSELNSSRAEWRKLQAELPLIELNIAQTIHRLSVLLGEVPGELFDCLSASSPLPEIPQELSIGVPSELLRRRPDICKAERELAAATERVGSAIAALFPRFSLRGFIGDISTHAGSLFSPASGTWLAGPQLLLPIFNSRLLLQDVDYNKQATQEALFNYQKTVLQALEEAENAIASFQHAEKHLLHIQEMEKNYHSSLSFAEELYERGTIDKFAVIKAKKGLISAEDLLIQGCTDQLINYIALYKALGGSWDNK